MSSFVAADFETDNNHGASACEIGVSVWNEGKLSDSQAAFVKVSSNYSHESYAMTLWLNALGGFFGAHRLILEKLDQTFGELLITSE